MLPRPLEICAACPLGVDGRGFSTPSGPSTSRLLLVGEALGAEEVKAGEPFVGAAGGMLSRLLALAGIDRATTGIANVISCQPPRNFLEGAPWEAGAVEWCSSHFLADRLRQLPPRGVVVPLGGVASRLMLRRKKTRWSINNWHSTVTYVGPGEGVHGTGDYFIVPTFHPSFLQRGASNLVNVAAFALSRAAGIAESGEWTTTPFETVIDPTVDWFASWVAMVEGIGKADPWKWWLTVDIETPDKAKGRAEDELSFEEDASYTITHVNFAVDPNIGVTVPYYEDYIPLIDRVLQTRTVKLFWNVGYDLPRLKKSGHALSGEKEGKVWDLMWAAHVLQSDLPLGEGFWAPLYSDAPPWKHLFADDFGRYRAFDAFQPLRIAHGLVRDLQREGLWSVFRRHIVDLDRYALVPAIDEGLQVDRDRLVAFKQDLEKTATRLLGEIEETAPRGSLVPKDGMKEKPGEDVRSPSSRKKTKKGGISAKQDWIAERAELVELVVDRPIQVCRTCGATEISIKHRCAPLPESLYATIDQSTPGVWVGKKVRKFFPDPSVVVETRSVRRWFWREPFNVDSPQQFLQLILEKGHQPGIDKRSGKSTTNKKTLETLEKTTGDPIYRMTLDYRAVKKVLSTYVEGAERRMKFHDSWGVAP